MPTKYDTTTRPHLERFINGFSFAHQQIKAILSEQRKQMEEDSKWLAQKEHHWHKNRFDSLNSAKSSDMYSEHDSTATSVYEDADCGAGTKSDELGFSLRQQSSQSLNKSDQHLYSESKQTILYSE